jgi:hypothetical protein
MFDTYSSPEKFMEDNGYVVDGAWYPRVTKIVGIKAKPALYRYYGEAASFHDAQATTQKSAEEGTLIHEVTEAILLGKKPDIPLSVAPAVEGFLKFLGDKNIQTSPEYIERRIFHPGERYAGTIDAMALIGGKFGVLDIKTSQGIYRDYNLQTAAYIEALKNQFQHLETRWILRIDQGQVCTRCGATRRVKGGREKIKTYHVKAKLVCAEGEHEWGETKGIIEMQEFPFWQSDFKAFLGAKQLWEWENEYWLKRVGFLN